MHALIPLSLDRNRKISNSLSGCHIITVLNILIGYGDVRV